MHFRGVRHWSDIVKLENYHFSEKKCPTLFVVSAKKTTYAGNIWEFLYEQRMFSLKKTTFHGEVSGSFPSKSEN